MKTLNILAFLIIVMLLAIVSVSLENKAVDTIIFLSTILITIKLVRGLFQ